MWFQAYSCIGGTDKFFRLTLGDETLLNYFHANFALMQFHKYSLTELESMLPWERDMYIILLMNHLEEEKQRAKEQEARNRRR